MPTREPLVIGPFAKGMNTFDDPTAIDDQEVVDALNFDPGLDGSLTSRPPFTSLGTRLIGATGKPRILGWFYKSNVAYMIVSFDTEDAASNFKGTFAYNTSTQTWVSVTNTIAAADMVQYDGKAWLVAPNGSAGNGGSWDGTTFTADAAMPKGESIASYKSRLWVANGASSSTPTRIQYSKVLGQASFWASPGSVDVGAGDGQSIVKLVNYFDVLLVFRSQSVWSFQYSTDPATGVQGVLVPGVGLTDRWSLAASENFLYFLYNNNAYEFINSKATQINKKVPFTFASADNNVTQYPFAVSVYADRVLYSYYDNVFVFSLRTRTWTRWTSDVVGAIGQITNPLNTPIDEAYMLPIVDIPNAQTLRTNLSPNPKAGVDLTGMTYSTSGSTATLSRAFAIGSIPVPGVTTAARLNLTVAASSWLRIDLCRIPVSAGSRYTASAWVAKRSDSGLRSAQVRIRWLNSTGSVITETGTSSPIDSTGWWRLTNVDALAPTGAVEAIVEARIVDGGSAGMDFYATAVLIENTSTLLDYFDGSTADDSTYYYRWDGATDLSTSVSITKRRTTLYHIQEALDDVKSEMFSCELQTKNYSFNLAGSFKVLFWWGVDAIFHTNVQGIASPIVFSNAVSWGRLLSQGFTWKALLSNSWAHPALEDPSIITNVSILNAGPQRKFVKFLKKLRFRQIFFRIRFDVDGSVYTSPVKIFNINAYMAEKQTVSKQIT